MKYFRLLLLCYLSICTQVYAQDVLSFEEAVAIALENNYGILLSQNEVSVATNNAHPGAAGLLPTVNATGGYTYTNSAVNVEFSTPAIESVDESGVVNTNVNAGLSVNYRLFDGLASQNTYRVLQRNAELSEAQTQGIVEATISQIGTAYYAVARLEESLETLSESAEISEDRLGRAQDQFEFGANNKLAILNAEVDLNTDSANLANSRVNLDNAKRNLNALLGRDVETVIQIDRSVEYSQDLSLPDLIEAARANNSSLKVATFAQEVAALNLKVAKAAYSPLVDLNAGYNFNRAENGPGNILQVQQNLGLSLGATVTIPIFSGNQRKVAVKNAEIAVQNSLYQQEEAELNVERDLSNAYYTFQTTLTQLELEQKSLEAAEENFNRTQEAFRLGQANNVQFREAQINLQVVRDRISDLEFTAKLSEIEIYRLSGLLFVEE